jgi:hypothetical protein
VRFMVKTTLCSPLQREVAKLLFCSLVYDFAVALMRTRWAISQLFTDHALETTPSNGRQPQGQAPEIPEKVPRLSLNPPARNRRKDSPDLDLNYRNHPH